MRRLFIIKSTHGNEDGSSVYLDARPKDGDAMTRYGDVRREQGMEAAEPLFPKEWEWVQGDASELPVADMPAITCAGEMMLEDVFNQFIAKFPGSVSNVHRIAIGDVALAWFKVPVIKLSDYADTETLPPLLLMSRSYERACSTEFKEWWEENEFTGIEFKAVS